MISVDAPTAFLLYLANTLVILLGLWIYRAYHAQRPRRLPQEVKLYACEFCHHVYAATPRNNLTQCPLCQSFNKGNPYKTKKKRLGA